MSHDVDPARWHPDVLGHPTVSRFAEPIATLFDAQALFAQQTLTVATLFSEVIRKPLDDYPTKEAMVLRAYAHLFLADLCRDQGRLVGAEQARYHYLRAERYAYESGEQSLLQRARLLRLGVVGEMSARNPKQLQRALAHYLRFAKDEQLTEVNRAWSLVWAGSVQTKLGFPDAALSTIRSGICILTNKGNPANSAYLKLTGAQLAAGNQQEALRIISELTLPPSAPILQIVRRETRLGNVLLCDPATFSTGAGTIRRAEQLARQAGLRHQVGSLKAIRARFGISLLD